MMTLWNGSVGFIPSNIYLLVQSKYNANYLQPQLMISFNESNPALQVDPSILQMRKVFGQPNEEN